MAMTSVPSCLGICFKNLLLKEIDANNSARAARPFRGEYISRSNGNVNSYALYFRLAEQRVPAVGLWEVRAQHGLGILRDPARREVELREDGGAQDAWHLRRCHQKRLSSNLSCIERKRNGDQHRGNGGNASLRGITA